MSWNQMDQMDLSGPDIDVKFKERKKERRTKPMHPSTSRASQRDQEHHLQHPGLVDLITTKQTTFLHR